MIFHKAKYVYRILISMNKYKIRTGFIDLRLILEDFCSEVVRINNIIRQKRHEYLYMFLKTVIVYFGIFIVRGKYKKAIIAYQLAREIYEGFAEV